MLLLIPEPYFIAFLCIISLVIGSFLNVIIYRLPRLLHTQWRNDCCDVLHIPRDTTQKITLALPRSFCVHCAAQIPIYHMIPLLSYLILRGRCADCNQRISLRYPFVEILSLILALSMYYYLGRTPQLLYALFFLWILICLFFIDIEHQLLPDSLTLGLLWLGLIANTQGIFVSPNNAILSAVGAYLMLRLPLSLYTLLTKKVGMGHGDYKLFAAFGAWFGWEKLSVILLVSSGLGAIVGIAYLYLTKQSKNTPIPFGPFLCVAGLLVMGTVLR